MRDSNIKQHIAQINKKKVPGKTSKYFGVFWNTQKGKWQVKMTVNYEQKHIGFFDDEEKAGLAYLEAVKKQWGSSVRMDDQLKLGLAWQL